MSYRCDNFLDKNRDYVIAEQQALLQVRLDACCMPEKLVIRR